jgi:hypothetical protein
VIPSTGVPERLENLAWRYMMLKPILFYVELNVLSILRFVWLSKPAVNDGKSKDFVADFI